MERPSEANVEIEELRAMSSSKLKEAAQQRAGTLQLETLAFVARHATELGPDGADLLQVASGALLRRVRQIAQSVKPASRKTDEDWQDGTQHAFCAMIRDFQQRETTELTFWEVNFRHIFKLRCIDGINAQRRKVDRESSSVERLADDGLELEADRIDPLDRLTQREVLAILSCEEATAVRLRWFDGLPMSGPGSVSEVMDVSRKTVYKYLSRAKAKVKADPRFDAWTGRG